MAALASNEWLSMGAEAEAAPEVDTIDQVAGWVEQFLKRYFFQLCTWVPPLVGFGIFLSYFSSNHFFPSFDLFQFSSLLLSAALIGFFLFAPVVAGIALPGLVTAHLFLNKKTLKGKLRRIGASEQEQERNALMLVLLCFTAPYLLSSLATSLLLVTFAGAIPISHALVSAVIAFSFGLFLQWHFKLAQWSFLQYGSSVFLALMIVKWVVLDSLTYSRMAFGGMLSGEMATIGIFLVPLALSFTISFFTMGAVGGPTHSLCFSVPLALAIAYYSGALTSMPERVVKGLGLGSYEAASLVMEPEFCEKNLPDFMSSAVPCVLQSPTVIWSLGDMFTLRVGKDGIARQVQIPSRFVKAIIRNPG
ncbi:MULTISPECIES: hypothetical protein [Pseudomonas]|uniref:hypothetical protein n=1 Tax=Pseudomonas TaxID=286 RepID=UPI0002A2CD02|nr:MULTISPECIES: hypothetical protein [Pseudomonas]NTX93118.1 hypothetical protein [Pseudomonas sp. UMA643]NTY21106.1 hypothetical protein [Pseudomonas sp. UMC3103]NTY27618.1 hypothetical protein [Pseudomonas sp. UMA603]NTY34167.1 hypothetical protein [Pseudomonas sp. UMC3129]NTY57349.1 hypothetical protein [Pseudomonas sp. UMC631]